MKLVSLRPLSPSLAAYNLSPSKLQTKTTPNQGKTGKKNSAVLVNTDHERLFVTLSLPSHSLTTCLQIPVISPSVMKVATTVFVGNISEKSSDTLLRQILLVR